MARKTDKQTVNEIKKPLEPVSQAITDTLKKNYMPYAMSVIVSRAIPEIDGFKPSHRKLLYTMYEMGLLNGTRKKSANIVGQTMKLNPHGDQAIYETMVRLTRGNEALLTPFIDSKGNFGKVYSRDMAYAASRYTEAKLDKICVELFLDIDKDAVDFVDNYDGEMKEPVLLPTTFPNILVCANTGIAVGMASNFCGFNLKEVCKTAIEYIKNKEHDILQTLPAPDFPTGGEIIFDEAEMRKIYETGRGSFKVRAKWQYIKRENIIEITQIPYTTTIEAIIDKIAELVKSGKIKEIADIRDETDLNGLKIAIDLKRNTDADKLMDRLFKLTPLMDSCSCNFNVLVGGMPKVLGISGILEEWVKWRTESIRRRVFFELNKKKSKMHLLIGLKKILVDLDKAINIIKDTQYDKDVMPNLINAFDIDNVQAEYIAEIRLRNINKEYILKRINEIEELKKEIDKLEAVLKSEVKKRNIIIKELETVIKKYPSERHSDIIYAEHIKEFDEDEHIDDYSVMLFLTNEGYFKKITPASWRMSNEHKLKDGDKVVWETDATNKQEIIFLTNMHQAYKARLYDFEDSKASVLGDYLPQKLGMEEGEYPVFAFLPLDYKNSMVIVFENGKVTRFPMEAFATKTNRRKLTRAYSDKSKPVAFFAHVEDNTEITLYGECDVQGLRAMTISANMIDIKSSRSTNGVQVLEHRTKNVVAYAEVNRKYNNPQRYKAKKIPGIGAVLEDEDLPQY